MFRLFLVQQVVYIAPMKALVRERIKDWKIRLEEKLGLKVAELSGDVTPDIKIIENASVIVTTPEKWDGISRSWQTRSYVKKVALIIIDEIHLLGEDRGPVLEVIVSRTNFISSHTKRNLRIVGLSTALANAVDLANWLGITNVQFIFFYHFFKLIFMVRVQYCDVNFRWACITSDRLYVQYRWKCTSMDSLESTIVRGWQR